MSKDLTRGTLDLVVAWTYGKSYVARKVKMSGDVAQVLRATAEATAGRLNDPTPYSPDSDMEDNSHMEAPRDESLDTTLVDELAKGPSLDLASQHELRTKPLACHALVFTSPSAQTIFVRKRSPIQLAKKSLLATMFEGTLDTLESPLFAFDDRFDAIITSDRVYVLDKRAFERLFKDSAVVLAKTTEWVKELAEVVPFADDSTEELGAILKQNSLLRNKFLAVRGRHYLGAAALTSEVLQAEILRCGLDPAALMEGGALKVTRENAKDILRLLNEDYFLGGFSKERYAASAKRSLEREHVTRSSSGQVGT